MKQKITRSRQLYSFIFPLMVLLMLVGACKKEVKEPTDFVLPPGNALQLTLDSLYLYAKQTYLWHQNIPDYQTFDPRRFVNSAGTLASMQHELEAITALAVDPSTQKSYEQRQGVNGPLYSFIANGNIHSGKRAAVNTDGQGNDFGLGLAVVGQDEVYVSFVESGSPAALAGVTRGMQVLSVDGINVPLNTNIISEILAGSTIGLQLKKQDGSRFSVKLYATSYTSSGIYKSTILRNNNRTIGYLAIARFGKLTTLQPQLESVFEHFANENIGQLIVDLRYNGGGYVETAEYLANLIAPSSANGAVMYAEHFNDLLQQGKAPILKSIPYLDDNGKQVMIKGRPATFADVDFSVVGNTYKFSKKGRLGKVSDIIFIVSEKTASASELLINCLKPYMNVRLVGSKTYGKPVGYFGIGLDKYTVFMPQFQILNAAQQGSYYQGMSVNIDVGDDVKRDFGDPEELCLAEAINAFYNVLKAANTLFASSVTLNQSTKYPKETDVKGMFENRLKLRQ